MTGFQSTPRVCPSDTQKPGFSCVCSSSPVCAPCLSFICPRLSSSDGYTCSLAVFIWTLSQSVPCPCRAYLMCSWVSECTEALPPPSRSWSWSLYCALPSELVVYFMESFGASLPFYGADNFNQLPGWVQWSCSVCSSPAVKPFWLHITFEFPRSFPKVSLTRILSLVLKKM